MIIDESRNGGSFELKLGDTFELVLGETPTAGFRWRLESDGTPNLILLDDSFEVEKTPGASGQRRWKFQGRRPGQTHVQLSYGRSWEQQTARSFTITVAISGDNPIPRDPAQ